MKLITASHDNLSNQVTFLRQTLQRRSAKLYLETAQTVRNLNDDAQMQEVRRWTKENFQHSVHLQNPVSRCSSAPRFFVHWTYIIENVEVVNLIEDLILLLSLTTHELGLVGLKRKHASNKCNVVVFFAERNQRASSMDEISTENAPC